MTMTMTILLADVSWMTAWIFQMSLGFIAVFLILLILVQRGRGGGLTGALGGMGGQSAFGTKAGDVFTRVTVVVAACWILLSMGALKVFTSASGKIAGIGSGSVIQPLEKGDDKKTEGEQTGTTPDDKKASGIGPSGDATEKAATEKGSAETPAEKPAEKSTDDKPAEAKPAENTKPADEKDTKPAEGTEAAPKTDSPAKTDGDQKSTETENKPANPETKKE